MEQLGNSLVQIIEQETRLLFCDDTDAVKMPSSADISEIMGKLSVIIFNDYNSKFGFSKDRLRRLLYDIYLGLAEQTEIAFALSRHPDRLIPNDANVRQLALDFVGHIHELRHLLYTDVDAILHNDPAASSPHEVISSYPAIRALLHYRSAHLLHQMGVPVIPRIITEIAHSETGIDIHPAARIGEYFGIDHGTGVVIGETCIIGSHVTLYQGVTLGARNFEYDAEGAPMNVPRHPIIEDNVTIYSNASVLGRITVGHDSIIGGNVWLTHSVAPHSRIIQGNTQAESTSLITQEKQK